MKAGLASFLLGLGAMSALGLGTFVEPSTTPQAVSQLGGALQSLLSIDDASAAPLTASQRCDDSCRQTYGVTVVDVLNHLPRQ